MRVFEDKRGKLHLIFHWLPCNIKAHKIAISSKLRESIGDREEEEKEKEKK